MSKWANDDEARALLARGRDQSTDLERALLGVAREVLPSVEKVRVVGNPDDPGQATVMMVTNGRQGHAVAGYAGLGLETEAVAAGNLTRMTSHCAAVLRAMCQAPA